jgi:hypothetical protein
LRRRGRKRPPDAEFLLKQVVEVFKEKMGKLGAEGAAKELGVCRASFYKYVAGENIPDMAVLLAAKEKWGVKWKYLDPSEVLRPLKAKSAEQLVFSFLSAMGEEDIEVVEVGPEGTNVLRVSLKIRIPAKH